MPFRFGVSLKSLNHCAISCRCTSREWWQRRSTWPFWPAKVVCCTTISCGCCCWSEAKAKPTSPVQTQMIPGDVRSTLDKLIQLQREQAWKSGKPSRDLTFMVARSRWTRSKCWATCSEARCKQRVLALRRSTCSPLSFWHALLDAGVKKCRRRLGVRQPKC